MSRPVTVVKEKQKKPAFLLRLFIRRGTPTSFAVRQIKKQQDLSHAESSPRM